MSTWKMLSAAAAVMLMTLVSAQAAPMTGGSEAVKAEAAQASESNSAVTEVRYRRGYAYGYGRGYGRRVWSRIRPRPVHRTWHRCRHRGWRHHSQ